MQIDLSVDEIKKLRSALVNQNFVETPTRRALIEKLSEPIADVLKQDEIERLEHKKWNDENIIVHFIGRNKFIDRAICHACGKEWHRELGHTICTTPEQWEAGGFLRCIDVTEEILQRLVKIYLEMGWLCRPDGSPDKLSLYKKWLWSDEYNCLY